MNIVIVGAGFTGIQLARRLINEKNEVTVIDNDEEVVRHVSNSLDCTVMHADGNNLETLEEAGISKAQALVCVTSKDEVNMITCSLVDAVYPDVLKIARVRNFAYYMNTEKVHKKHAETFSGKHRPLYGIDFMIHPDVEAAQAIVQAVEGGAVSNVITFENSEYELTRVIIEKKSKFSGLTLQNLRSLTKIPFLVAYVESNGTTKLPSGSTELHVGDSIGVLTKKGDISKILELTGTEVETLDKIALVGAGKIGTLIAEKLLSAPKKKFILSRLFGKSTKLNSNFTIVDLDKELAKEAAEKFPTAKVFCGDITDENFLYEENLTTYDLVICATHNHELNMVGAAYLESLGVGKSVSLVENAAFAEIARKLGVDVPVPLRDAVVDSILSHLRGKTVTGIHTLSSGSHEIIELTISIDSKIIGKTLPQIANPGKFLVMLIKKAGTENYQIPTGTTTIEVNDQVILIVDADQSKKLLASFGVK
ncbi:MAG: NAD-binding protein [Treponema sp.]|uniref:NAD-binding protein n=1 Tax=Treponema sp. TaxID=166 RepID=UPI001B7C1FC5|nr:NAD-binding protein [Treponema sp.]MBP5402118.1 NAD-binding protein [Treponema sp.]MBR5933453.1 NAD-binding protein [Treponema sp.]